VFADGIGSSGKGMLSHLLSSLSQVEKQSNHYAFDYVSYLHWLGKLSTDAAITYLQTEADFQLYHLMMSRDVNFRPHDSTGVFQNARRFEYFRRLFLSEGDPVLRRIEIESPILNEAPHDALRSAQLFFDAFQNRLQIIYILRDPRELILDWHRRGFGRRIGTDPREFQFSFSEKGQNKPMFMLDNSKNLEKLNEIETLVYMINFIIKHNLDGYRSLVKKFKNSVLLIKFDDLALNPHGLVDHIARFMGTKRTRRTNIIIKRENLPRRLTDKSQLELEISEHLDPETFQVFEEAMRLYEEFCSYVGEN
jgi:hypothetical protein